MNNTPLVSITVVVKNGMPFIKAAIESLRKQTYKNFEIIVQDAVSTDGTLEYLQSISDMKMSIRSRPDNGPSQGWNRAIRRCKGEIVGSLDADNILKPNALKIAVNFYKKDPTIAVIYGNNISFKNDEDIFKRDRDVGPIRVFSVIRLLRCDLVPAFESTYFFRKNCKKNLYINESMIWGGDYDLWLRVSHLKVLAIPNVVAFNRKHKQSYTQIPKLYRQFTAHKIEALKRYLSSIDLGKLHDSFLEYCMAGIYAWAADSVYTLEGNSKDYKFFVDKTLMLDPYSERIRFINQRIDMNRPINRFKTRVYKFYKAFNSTK